MDKMMRVHLRIIIWVIIAFGAYIFASWITVYFWKIRIPTKILLIVIAGCMVTDAYLRIRFLLDQGLEKNESKHIDSQKKIFLMAVPAELLFAFLCFVSWFE